MTRIFTVAFPRITILFAIALAITETHLVLATNHPDMRLPDASSRLFYLAASLLSAWWIVSDMRARSERPPLDLGYFVVFTFPFGLVYYLLSRRGVAATLRTAVFGVLLLAGTTCFAYLVHLTFSRLIHA